MKRLVVLLAATVLALVLGAPPAAAQCGVDKACANIPAGSSANVMAGLIMAAWDMGPYDCSTSALPNGMILVRVIDPVTGRVIDWYVVGPFGPGAGPFTTVPHTIELRPSYPPTVPRVPFDLNLKVDGNPEVVLQNGATTIGEIQVQVSNLALGSYSGSPVPALGTVWRVVLGLGVVSAALWFILRRSA